jgi:hypothetical protein
VTENTWFRTTQGWGPANTVAGVNIGLISVHAATDSGLGSDACFSPFFKHAAGAGVGSGESKVAVAAVGGLFGGTTGAPFGVSWEFNFSWGATPVTAPNKLGDDSGDLGIPILGVPARGVGNPLLSNIIFEVQGPLNGATLGSCWRAVLPVLHDRVHQHHQWWCSQPDPRSARLWWHDERQRQRWC